jgi:hypothetical protein
MKKLAIFIGIVIILILAYFLLRKPKATKDESSTTAGTTTTANDNFPLKLGSRGDRVKNVQKAINKKITASTVAPYNPQYITEDGIWGNQTETNIIKYFSKNILTETDYNNITNVWR